MKKFAVVIVGAMVGVFLAACSCPSCPFSSDKAVVENVKLCGGCGDEFSGNLDRLHRTSP